MHGTFSYIHLSPSYPSAGYGQYIVARPKFYDIILRQVPPEKIHFGKRVLNISEDENKATIHLSNNEMYEGDIVVGADGAYSAVRQRMYEQLKQREDYPRKIRKTSPSAVLAWWVRPRSWIPKSSRVSRILSASSVSSLARTSPSL